MFPNENIIKYQKYREILVNVGFEPLSIRDEIRKTWGQHYKIRMRSKLMSFIRKPTISKFIKILNCKGSDLHQSHYILAAAQKPQT